MLHEPLAHDAVGARERFVNVAVVVGLREHHVAARAGPDRGPAGITRLIHRGDGRQLLVVDHDETGGVLGDVTRLGHDQRNRIADQPHAVDGERIEDRVVEALERHQPHERIGERGDVGAGEHCDDAGKATGLGDVDAANGGVGGGAADERRVQHVGHGDVVDVAPVPGEQPGVFDPRDLRPHEPAGHRLTHVVPVRRDPEPTV